jgi:hypothetical protein
MPFAGMAIVAEHWRQNYLNSSNFYSLEIGSTEAVSSSTFLCAKLPVVVDVYFCVWGEDISRIFLLRVLIYINYTGTSTAILAFCCSVNTIWIRIQKSTHSLKKQNPQIEKCLYCNILLLYILTCTSSLYNITSSSYYTVPQIATWRDCLISVACRQVDMLPPLQTADSQAAASSNCHFLTLPHPQIVTFSVATFSYCHNLKSNCHLLGR